MNRKPCDSCGGTTYIRQRYYNGTWTCNDCAYVENVRVDWMPERVKEDRKKYFKDILQPYRDGKLSREFVETYPDRAKHYGSQREISKSKYVWKDTPGWGDHFNG